MPMTLPLNTQRDIDPDSQRILQFLPQIQAELCDSDTDAAFLRKFLRSRELQQTMKMYKRLYITSHRRMRPVTRSSVALAANTFCDVKQGDYNEDTRELLRLLSKPHIQALLYTHDRVASREYEPAMMNDSIEITHDEKTMKIVHLVKSDEPLGVTIQMKEDTGAIEIARILHGGAAHRSGLIHVGDEIHEINGVQFQGRHPDEMAYTLSQISGPVTMKLGMSENNGIKYRVSKTRMKALFSYDASDDIMIPCPEAGLSFNQGEILHIISQNDSLWWQAQKEGDPNLRTGLIPASLLQERREMLRKASEEEDGISRGSRSISPCRISPKIPRSRRVKKMMYQAILNGEFDHGEVPTYEEVELAAPDPTSLRPLVLIGAPNVGRNELKRRLIASNPGHFVDIVPYTTRPKRTFEEDGKEYHFITREEMEAGIIAHRFVEHGEYKGNLYGTKSETIKQAIQSGKMCILCPNPQAIKFLRTREIKPYIIFIKPPVLEKLRETRIKHGSRVTQEDGTTRPFTEEDLIALYESSKKLEEKYGYLFDITIYNNNLHVATNELLKVANSVETESHWVPVSWIQ